MVIVVSALSVKHPVEKVRPPLVALRTSGIKKQKNIRKNLGVGIGCSSVQ
jgi:hypothetical protein